MRFGAKTFVTLLVAVTTVMSTASCGSGSGGGSSGDSDAGFEFTYVTGAPGDAQATTATAIDNINARYGYKGKWVQIANSDLVVQGMAAGKFDLATGTTSAVMAIMQKGASLTFIGEEEHSTWNLVFKSDMKGCADLNGKRLGLQSAGGVSTALYKLWFSENCSQDDQPQLLYVNGSPNRVQGLLADQLDAAMVETPDLGQLPTDRFHTEFDFSTQLPQVKTTLFYSSNDFLQKHPEVVTRLLAEVDRLHQQVNTDPNALADMVRKKLPEQAKDADQIAKLSSEAKLYPNDVSITLEDLNKTADAYAKAGLITAGFDWSKFLNTDLSAAAAKEAGGSS